MTAPTQLSEDDAKKDYLALCLKMSHAQLYAELMRLHKEATLLVQQAVEQEREACAQLFDDHDIWDEDMSQMIRARGQDGNRT